MPFHAGLPAARPRSLGARVTWVVALLPGAGAGGAGFHCAQAPGRSSPWVRWPSFIHSFIRVFIRSFRDLLGLLLRGRAPWEVRGQMKRGWWPLPWGLLLPGPESCYQVQARAPRTRGGATACPSGRTEPERGLRTCRLNTCRGRLWQPAGAFWRIPQRSLDSREGTAGTLSLPQATSRRPPPPAPRECGLGPPPFSQER